MLKFCAAGFIGPFELFSNRISRVLAALTLAHAIIIPLDNAEVGETDTALPVVAPVTVTLTVLPLPAGILGTSILFVPLTIPFGCTCWYYHGAGGIYI